MAEIDVVRLLQQFRLTEAELAERLSVHPRTVSRWVSSTTMRPRGPARKELLRMQASLTSATIGSRVFRIGICPEFTDTTLPVLANSTGVLAGYVEGAVEFHPIPWDDRAMRALCSGFLQGVLFNQRCAERFAATTAACVEFVGEPFVSGAPYIAFSLPSPVPSTDLLNLLWHPQTIKIVPYADMELTMRLVREGCRRSSGKLHVLAARDDETRWFRCSAGHGVRLFLNPPAFWGNSPIAYIGGQDHRALIELAREQTTDRMIIVLVEPGKGLDVAFPDSLRTNWLIGIGLPAQKLDSVADAISEVRRLMSANEAVRNDALTEIIRWRNLHGSAEESEFGDTRREFETTLPKMRTYSAELGRWF